MNNKYFQMQALFLFYVYFSKTCINAETLEGQKQLKKYGLKMLMFSCLKDLRVLTLFLQRAGLL